MRTRVRSNTRTSSKKRRSCQRCALGLGVSWPRARFDCLLSRRGLPRAAGAHAGPDNASPYFSLRFALPPCLCFASSFTSGEKGFVVASGSEAGDLCARVGGHSLAAWLPVRHRRADCVNWNLNNSGALFLAQPIWDSCWVPAPWAAATSCY